MVEHVACPVCGTVNPRDYECNEFCLCEDHYFCYHCSYFSDMAYSSYYIGICEDYPKQYKDIVKKLNLRVVKPEEVP